MWEFYLFGTVPFGMTAAFIAFWMGVSALVGDYDKNDARFDALHAFIIIVYIAIGSFTLWCTGCAGTFLRVRTYSNTPEEEAESVRKDLGCNPLESRSKEPIGWAPLVCGGICLIIPLVGYYKLASVGPPPTCGYGTCGDSHPSWLSIS